MPQEKRSKRWRQTRSMESASRNKIIVAPLNSIGMVGGKKSEQSFYPRRKLYIQCKKCTIIMSFVNIGFIASMIMKPTRKTIEKVKESESAATDPKISHTRNFANSCCCLCCWADVEFVCRGQRSKRLYALPNSFLQILILTPLSTRHDDITAYSAVS